jgi:phi13 family phage major tail protein
MAVIGLRYPVWAPYASGGSGAAIVYGTPVVGDHAIEASISWERNTNVLYGDDMPVEQDNSIMSGTITFQFDHLSTALRASMLGMTGSGSPTTYEESDAVAPHGGFGYIKVLRNNGTQTYEAYWIHDVQFTMGDETAVTRGENIEWQTPTVEGKIFPAALDTSGVYKFRKMQVFATEALAKEYLNTIAGVS